MKKYLPILLLWACNSSSEKEIPSTTISNKPLSDSISLIVDSLKEWTENISDISSYAIQAQAKIKRLESEKKATEHQIEVYPMALSSENYVSDDRDRIIAELRKKVYDYENQIAALKSELYRTEVKVDRVPNKIEVEKPNDKSLIITLSGTLEQGASVWIMESNRKSKKIMKGYYNCQLKDLNSLGAIQAKQYKGTYFFNDVPVGKYLIKVCALYGDWVEVKRKDEHQTVAMKVAPPIQ
jgi:chromosome segregation ATPase